MAREMVATLLRKCSNGGLLSGGAQLHGSMVKMGIADDVILRNYLIDMYGKCGRIDFAANMFDEMTERNVVSWTALIVGFLLQGNSEESLQRFLRMRDSEIKPNEFTLSTVIKACAHTGILENGSQIHGVCIKTGYELHSVVNNAIIFMYSRTGRLDEAKRMFDIVHCKNLVTWNSIIAGFSYVGDGWSSLKLFKNMLKEGEMPDEYTFASLLKGCGVLEACIEGIQVHALLIKNKLNESRNAILSGALMDLYVKCGSLYEARKVFDLSREKNVIQWTNLIAGYAQEGDLKEVIDLFRRFCKSGIKIDGYVLSSMIGIFADFALIEQGKQIHALTVKEPYNFDVSIGNSIVDMYMKCGLIFEAEIHFGEMEKKNVVSWTVMINGYGKHGNGRKAINLFNEMLIKRIEPDEVTYLALLSSCSHAGLVEECREYYVRLLNDNKVKPRVEHYACMVDLLGRAGKLLEAKDLIDNMPVQPSIGIWQTLLSACRVHKNLKMAMEVQRILLRIDADNSANYVILSNIFAEAGLWKECENIRELMKRKGLKKQGGWSWMQINKKVHIFYGGENTHPLISEIHKVLKEVERRLKEELGYVSRDRVSILHDVDDEAKEDSLRVHSERLAVGLWMVCEGGAEKGREEVIRVYKNLRVCGDCHEFLKGVSKVFGRVLLVRDANRFHRFEHGVCSCGDYW